VGSHHGPLVHKIILDELHAIISTAILLGVPIDRIEISPLLTVPPGQYSGFISKAFVISKGIRTCLSVFTIGRFSSGSLIYLQVCGRYDLRNENMTANGKSGVGLSLAIEQLWDMLAVAEVERIRAWGLRDFMVVLEP
jgi:hypothetical protein